MKLWSGRFQADLDNLAERFNDSLPFDAVMYAQDIRGSIAHATMLGECGIIAERDAQTITSALESVRSDIADGKLAVADAEDIHSFVENELVRRIGDVGKKLHTARSRNDQVATDLRLYLRDGIDKTNELLSSLITLLAAKAEQYIDAPMPAYTHMQKAQPTTLGHWFCAYANMFLRDLLRLADCRSRLNVLPLGSGAAVATAFPIDRRRVAELLGFDGITENSLDGVSDRDFCLEYLSCAAIIMTHLSRVNEEFVYYSGEEFGFIKLPDEFSTGSSIMPQKKNPDVNELLRGKSGRVLGDLVGMFTVMKGLPLAYNKDMQEDKERVFDADETVRISLAVFTRMLAVTKFDRDRMNAAAAGGFSCATECADYLANKGVPFRTAHEIVGKIVLYCVNNNKTLQSLTVDEYKAFSPLFDADIKISVMPETAISRRTVIGGCEKTELLRQISVLREAIK